MKDLKELYKDVCPVDTALCLKKIGYNKFCNLMYCTDFTYEGKSLSYEDELDLKFEGKADKIKEVPFGKIIGMSNYNSEHDEHCCSAPCMHDVEDWLRETYNIHIAVNPRYCIYPKDPESNGKIMYHHDALVIKDPKQGFVSITHLTDACEDYWESLNKAILQAISYIDNNKQSNK